MFLSYYGDIDGESHSFGAQSSQTQSAIDDKVMFVREGINAITALDAMTQTRTIFFITSDHGHVDAGGHGGDAYVLKIVPLICICEGFSASFYEEFITHVFHL